MTRDELIEAMARAHCPYKENPCPGSVCSTCRIPMERALAAAEAAGFTLAPKVATESMILAGWDAPTTMAQIYAAMIAASARPERDVGDAD
jgi:hypothetical protein